MPIAPGEHGNISLAKFPSSELTRSPFVVDLSMDFLCFQVPPPVDYTQHDDIRRLGLINNAVGVERKLPDFFAAELRHHSPNPG
jgi:hypothetical protein